MRRAIGFFSVVAALGLAGCDLDFTGLEQLDQLCLSPCGGYGGPSGGAGTAPSVTLAPDSLRLKVGEAAEVRETGGIGVEWSSRDSTIARVAADARLTSTAQVAALRSGKTWVIGYNALFRPDSVRVVVE